MDFGDKCDVPNGYGIDFLLDKPGTWYSNGSSRSIMCNVENEPCESALCEVLCKISVRNANFGYQLVLSCQNPSMTRFFLKHE